MKILSIAATLLLSVGSSHAAGSSGGLSCEPDESLFEFFMDQDTFSGESSWKLIDFCTRETVGSGGPYDQDVVHELLCLPDQGRYDFTITDSFGDGLVPPEEGDSEPGFYQLIYKNAIIHQGADFGSSETIPFGVETCPLPDCPPGTSPFLFFMVQDVERGPTIWDVKDFCTGASFGSGGAYPDQTLVQEPLCLPSGGRYVFTITDFSNNGLLPADGSQPGFYELTYEDSVVYTGSDFGFSESILLGANSCPYSECPAETSPFLFFMDQDAFKGESSWTIIDQSANTVVESGGPYEMQDIVEEFRCLPVPECYKFQIVDRLEDGLVPTGTSFPIGSYELSFEGILFHVGGVFSLVESVSFGEQCVEGGPPSCDEGLSQLTVDLDLDRFPGETRWKLTAGCDDETQLVDGGGPYGEGQDMVKVVLCLPPGEAYTFSITDDFGDGLNEPPVGSYRLTFDGKILREGGDFGSLEETKFGDTCPDGKTIAMNGDPHLHTWGGEWIDYQGECDIVFLSNAVLGLLIYVRLTRRYDYSYIEAVAVMLGEEVFEVTSFGGYALDSVDGASLDGGINGYPIYHTRPSEKQHVFDIVIGRDEYISIGTFKDLCSVKIVNGTAHNFGNSTGIMGNYHTGKLLSRDGKSVLSDPVELGEQWQVRADEPRLFRTDRAPQLPQEKCRLPTTEETAASQLRGAISKVNSLDAQKACARYEGAAKSACVDDVIKTGDLDIASTSEY